MIKNLNAKYVIIGHSDNRAEGDTDITLKKKVIFALEREQEYERWDPQHDYAEADCPYEWHDITDLITKFKIIYIYFIKV